MSIKQTIALFIILVSLSPLRAQIAFAPGMFGVHHRSNAPKIDFENLTINPGSVVTATILVTPQAGVVVTQKGLCYSTAPAPTIDGTKTTNGGGNERYYPVISSLTGGAIYYVRPYATIGTVTYYGSEKRMVVFYYTGGSQNFTVPEDAGTAKIRILGAQGGSSYSSSPGLAAGGLGALMEGIFSLTPGSQITFDIGQKGGDGYPFYVMGSGGGGGTFVYSGTTSKIPLIIAGGGGGGIVFNSSQRANGQDGQAGSDGTSGIGYEGASTSGRGQGGYGGSSAYGGAGAGWYSAGTTTSGKDLSGKRNPWLGGNSGSSYGRGGYGGGGSAWWESQGGSAGGGGGWSGGGSSVETISSGGGGGSYNSAPAATQVSSSGVQSGNGAAIITW